MKVNKKLISSILSIAIALSLLLGTLLYANAYTSKYSANNTRIPEGKFQSRDNRGFPGDFKKPEK
jgi:hypothetical protein